MIAHPQHVGLCLLREAQSPNTHLFLQWTILYWTANTWLCPLSLDWLLDEIEDRWCSTPMPSTAFGLIIIPSAAAATLNAAPKGTLVFTARCCSELEVSKRSASRQIGMPMANIVSRRRASCGLLPTPDSRILDHLLKDFGLILQFNSFHFRVLKM